MDVRRKQRFSYHGSSEILACRLPVSAHVISIVRRLSWRKVDTTENEKSPMAIDRSETPEDYATVYRLNTHFWAGE